MSGDMQKKLHEYFAKAGISEKKSEGADFRAKKIVGAQALDWMLNGSPKEPTTPPVKDTYLRGSGSAHVGMVYVSGNDSYKNTYRYTNTIKENFNTITVAFNVYYAVYQHEMLKPAGSWEPGIISQTYSGVGGKFLEKHILNDGEAYLDLYADVFKRDTKG